MPVYKLAKDVPATMIAKARALADLRVSYALLACPFGLAQMQDWMVPPDALRMIETLHGHGVEDMPLTKEVNVAARRGGLPGLSRTVVLYLTLPKQLFYVTNHAHYWHGNGPCTVDPVRVETAKLLWLDKLCGDAPEVVAWLNNIIAAVRQRDFLVSTVTTVVEGCQNTGQVMGNWPFLATLMDDGLWRGRLRNHPRDLRRYAFATPRWAAFQPALRLAETLLLGAQMLTPVTHAPDAIQVQVKGIERFATDRYPGV